MRSRLRRASHAPAAQAAGQCLPPHSRSIPTRREAAATWCPQAPWPKATTRCATRAIADVPWRIEEHGVTEQDPVGIVAVESAGTVNAGDLQPEGRAYSDLMLQIERVVP